MTVVVDNNVIEGDFKVNEEELPQFHTVLEVWREVLKPAAKEATKKVTPQWAGRMIESYTGLKFSDMVTFRDLYFSRIAALYEILLGVIALDDEALTYRNPQEDVEHNSGHYKTLLLMWQQEILRWELSWDCLDPNAAVDLATISEVYKMFFGQQGITAFLDNIKFEFNEDDQAFLASELEALRAEVTGE